MARDYKVTTSREWYGVPEICSTPQWCLTGVSVSEWYFKGFLGFARLLSKLLPSGLSNHSLIFWPSKNVLHCIGIVRLSQHNLPTSATQLKSIPSPCRLSPSIVFRQDTQMAVNPVHRLLSRATLRAVKRPNAVPSKAFQQVPRIVNARFNSTTTADFTVRDALNTALAEE